MIKIISKNTNFTSQHLKIVDYHLQSKTGKELTHHVAIRRPTVSIFPITKQYDIYLIKQYRYQYQRIMLEAIAGFVDEGEAALAAAKRELAEESGLRAKEWIKLSEMELAGSVVKATCHLFVAKDITQGEAKLEDDEEIEVVKIPLEQAVKDVLLGKIDTSMSALGILMIDAMQREGKI